MSGSRILVPAAILALVAASCANRPITKAATGDPTTSLAPCQGHGAEFVPAFDYLSNVQAWFEVEKTSPAFTDQSIIDADRTFTIEMQVAPVNTLSDVGATTTLPIAIHSSYLPGLGWALDTGGQAFLAMGQGFEEQIVLYTLIRPADGTHFFAGECASVSLTQPIEDQLGKRTDEVLDELIGMTDQTEILRLLEGPSESPQSPPPTILDPQTAPADLLDQLSLLTLAVERPNDWIGPFTICTEIEAGWNDCLDMSSEPDPLPTLSTYVGDPPTLQVWLLDPAANVERPIELLGTLDLSTYRDVIDAKGGGLITIRVGGVYVGSDVNPPIGDPTVKVVSATPWSAVSATPSSA